MKKLSILLAIVLALSFSVVCATDNLTSAPTDEIVENVENENNVSEIEEPISGEISDTDNIVSDDNTDTTTPDNDNVSETENSDDITSDIILDDTTTEKSGAGWGIALSLILIVAIVVLVAFLQKD